MNKKIIALVIISLICLPVIKSGAAMTVCPACTALCVIPFNPLCAACVATLCVFGTLATACFDSDTIISKIEDGQIKKVSIYELKSNDLVLANNNENKFTRVVRNVKSEGLFGCMKER